MNAQTLSRRFFFGHLTLLVLVSTAIIIGGIQWGRVQLKHGHRYAAEKGKKTATLIALPISSGSLRDWDEAWYAQISKEMQQQRNYLFLRYQNEHWFDKPPLSFWMTALFYHYFGINEFSARLFSAICGVLTILVCALLGSHFFGNRLGPLAGWILLTSGHFIQYARRGQTDVPVTFFITLTLYFFLLGLRHKKYFWLAGIAWGAALMTKGSIAFLAGFIALFFLLFSRQTPVLKSITFWGGLTLGLMIALPWHLYQYFSYPEAFVRAYFGDHLGRLFDAPSTAEGNPFYYYFVVLFEDYRPWFLFVYLFFIASFWNLFQRLRQHQKAFPSHGELFALCWMITVFGLFSLASTRLGWYLIPIYPGLALFLIAWLERLASQKIQIKTYSITGLQLGIAFLIVNFLLFPTVTRKVSHIQHNPEIKAIAPLLQKYVPPHEKVLVYSGGSTGDKHFSIFMPSTLFYGDRFVQWMREDAEALRQILSQNPQRICLVNQASLNDLQQKSFSLDILAQQDHLYLIRWKDDHD